MPSSFPVARTLLYVPGDRPDRIAKALTSGADVVSIDLEDAVAPSHKAVARAGLADVFAEWHGIPAVQVRINGRGSDWHEEDIAAVAELPRLVAVRIPKATTADDVRAITQSLPGREVHALIESALGAENAFEIARSGVTSVGLGEADLRSQLGLPAGPDGDPGLDWPRTRIVYAAAAAGLPPPLMSVYPHVRDLDGLRASCAAGRRIGFFGRAAIHPGQLATIQEAFTPSAADVDRARETLKLLAGAESDRTGTATLSDGSFLDVAMLRAALRTVAIAELSGTERPQVVD
ncbi:HpcH/HpaI aldolase/citrate lyase family protein [Ornithinimicrobium faecis]|nr:CoA ester lyase [Ornithinimicrobium sp. HY1793]